MSVFFLWVSLDDFGVWKGADRDPLGRPSPKGYVACITGLLLGGVGLIGSSVLLVISARNFRAPERSGLFRRLAQNGSLLQVERELNSEAVFLDSDDIRMGSTWIFFPHLFDLQPSEELATVAFEQSGNGRSVAFHFDNGRTRGLMPIAEQQVFQIQTTLRAHFPHVALEFLGDAVPL
jgi:hypothetical protein